MRASTVVVTPPADMAGARGNLALLCRRLHERQASGTLTLACTGGSGGITWNTGEIDGVSWSGEIGFPAFILLVDRAGRRMVEWSFQTDTRLHARPHPLPPTALLLELAGNPRASSKRISGPVSTSLRKATEIEIVNFVAGTASAHLRKEWHASPPQSMHDLKNVVARTLRALRLPPRAANVVLSRIASRVRRARRHPYPDQESTP